MKAAKNKSVVTIITTMPSRKSFTSFEKVPFEIYKKEALEQVTLHKLEKEYLEVCLVVLTDKRPVARLGIYLNPHLLIDGKTVATIGAYESVDDAKYWRPMLTKALQISKEKGCTSVIGPMSGSTWNDYRFLEPEDTKSNDLFFGEPYNHQSYPRHFKEFGFEKIQSYCSLIDQTPSFKGFSVEESKLNFERKGFVFRSINLNAFEEDLKKIHAFSNTSFKNNFLFSPIDQEEFLRKFLPLKNSMHPSFVLFAEYKKELVGLVLSFHDYNSKKIKRLVLKTLVRKKGEKYKGIGKMLSYMVVKEAREQGYQDIIHALMNRTNYSVDLSRKSMGEEFKKYSLYGTRIIK